MYILAPQFRGRIGPNSAGPAYDFGSRLRQFLVNPLERLRRGVRSILNHRFEGIHGRTATDIIGQLLQLPRQGEYRTTANLMQLLRIDPSAHEILPAYLLLLSQQYQVPAYIKHHIEVRGQRPLTRETGPMHKSILTEYIDETYRRIHAFGFDQ